MTVENNNLLYLQQEDSIDIKALVFKILAFWKLFVLSVVVAMLSAYFFNKYADPDYEAKATILVSNDQSAQNPLSDLMPSVFGPPPINMANEMVIIKSFDITKRAIKKTDWQISYWRYGQIRENQMFADNPFTVIIDTSHLQATQVKIDIVLINNKQYKLIIPPLSSAKLYDFRTKEMTDVIDSLPGGENRIMNYGEKYENGCFSFTLKFNAPYNDDKEFYFYLNSLDYLANKYNGKFNAKMLDNDGTLIGISLKDESQSNAVTLVNALAEAYVEANLDEKNQQAINSIKFIDEQLFGIEDSLRVFEMNLQNFRINNKLMKIEDVSSQTFERLYELDRQKAMAELHDQYYDYLKEYIENSNKNKENLIAPAIMDIQEPMLIQLVSQLNTLYMERNQFGTTTTKENPYVKEIDQKINSTERALLENIENIKKVSKIHLNEINSQIAEIQIKINSLPEKQRRLVDITRQYKVNEDIYSFLLEKRLESGISKAGNVSDHKIIDRARKASQVFPKTSLNYTIALLLGLIIPLGFIFVRDYFNDKVRDKRDIESIVNIPILGVVGHHKGITNTAVLSKPKSIIAETFRAIITNLQFIASEQESKIITVTSTFSGEGKTFNAINLASIYSISNRKTVLVGCDLRKPKIHDDFDFTNNTGLTTFLIGKCTIDEMIQKTEYENFHVITSGPVPPNPAELLESNKMDDLLRDLKERYDIIIIDSPPVGLVTDAFFMMKRSDATLYVVRQNYTSKSALNTLKELVNSKVVKNISIIVNDMDYEDKRYGGYGYGYGYDYGYGEKKVK